MAKIMIDPVSRIEGHLAVELTIADGKVRDARCRGSMFRGFEAILKGRSPADAVPVTERICGVCPVSHGIASSLCLEKAFGIRPNKNGRLLRNIILASNFLQSHVLHFYHLAALDYVDVKAVLSYKGKDIGLNRLKAWIAEEADAKTADSPETVAAPFLPRYEGKDFYLKDDSLNQELTSHFLAALAVRLKCHQLVSIFGGRAPHPIGLVPGGVTQVPTNGNVSQYLGILDEIEAFVRKVYVPDVITLARAFPAYTSLGGFNSFLSFGGFPESDGDDRAFLFPEGAILSGKTEKPDISRITEHVRYAWYSSGTGLHPSKGETVAAPDKKDAYTWVKSPRYRNSPVEVGPAGRMIIASQQSGSPVNTELTAVLRAIGLQPSGLSSVMGRHAARAAECGVLCASIRKWVSDLEIGKPPRTAYEVPAQAEGQGLIEAPRGALGHFISIRDSVIARYQCVVPTTWNASPLDDKGVKGPMEQALIGVPVSDEKNPIEAARVVRSFDPCLACAIHVMRSPRQQQGLPDQD